jgi:hypothetical protein
MIPSVSSALIPYTRKRILTVNQTEFGPGVADVRVTVEGVWNTVGSPSSVSHGCLTEENLLHVDPGNIAVLGRERSWESFSNVFTEGSDFADFLEKNERRVWRVSVDSDTCPSALSQGWEVDLPAESYPRYSSRARPLQRTSQTYARSFSTR